MFRNVALPCAVATLEHIHPCGRLSLLAVIHFRDFSSVQQLCKHMTHDPRLLFILQVVMLQDGTIVRGKILQKRFFLFSLLFLYSFTNVIRIWSIYHKSSTGFVFLSEHAETTETFKSIANFGRICAQQLQSVLLHWLAFLHSVEELSSGSWRRQIWAVHCLPDGV